MKYTSLIDDMVWSYTRLTTYETCPYMWEKKYIFGEEETPKFFTLYGSMMHKIIESYLKNELTDETIVEFYSDKYINELCEAPSDKIYENYYKQGLNYVNNIGTLLPKRKDIEIEQHYSFEFAGYPFVGFIDMVSKTDDGKIVITDHKSHMLRNRSNRKTPTRYDQDLDKHLRQLYMYAEAYYQKHGVYPDVLELNSFRNGTVIDEPFDEAKLKETEKWAKKLIKEIRRNYNWKPNEEYFFCKNICGVECTPFD